MIKAKLIMAILVSGIAMASETPQSMQAQPGEDLIVQEIEGRKGGTHSHPIQRLAIQDRPANTDINSRARKAFRRLGLQRPKKNPAKTLRARQADGEFFFDEVEGKQANTDSFLVRHASQQGLPASLDAALGGEFRAQAAETAWQAFSKIKFRGTGKGRSSVWRTVGPETVSGDGTLEPKNSSGRVTDLATGVSCSQDDCRLYVGTAGGGLWRSDRALNLNYPRWRLLSNGLESNNIGAVTVDPNDPGGLTLYVGTGESNFSFTSAAGKGLFSSMDGGEHFARVPTLFTDLEISPQAIDFTATRGISQVTIEPGAPDTIYVSTTIAMLGMTSVRGGQSNITGGPQTMA